MHLIMERHHFGVNAWEKSIVSSLFFLETAERGRVDNSIISCDIHTVVLVTMISTTNINAVFFHP